MATRQEISAHCLKWSKKSKEAFTSAILAVIILRLFECWNSNKASRADLLPICSPATCAPGTNMHVGILNQSQLPLICLEKLNASLVLFFIALPWMDWLMWTVGAASATQDRLSILFSEARWELQPPSPRPKLRKYRQAGHRNSVTSYWAPKSVGNPMVQYYSL